MSKLILPPEKKVRRLHVQHDLIESQLPKYLQRLIDAEAEIQSVVKASSGYGIGSRYSVIYSHHEEFETEIYC